jgi:hypothetical protein
MLAEELNENPDPSGGSHVVTVDDARRSNDTLRSLGLPDGIEAARGSPLKGLRSSDPT